MTDWHRSASIFEIIALQGEKLEPMGKMRHILNSHICYQIFIYFMCMFFFGIYVCLSTMCAVTKEARRGTLDPLELLQMVVNHCVGAENSYWYIKDTQ